MRKFLAVTLLILMVVSFVACSNPEKSILGTWKHQSTVLGVVTETTYTFSEGGSGTKSNVLEIDFVYSFSEEKLLITTSTLGIEVTEEYTYEFKADKLILTGEKDVIELEKIN